MPITLNGTTGIQNVLGSASAPAESNTTSSNTGLYFPSSTTLGLATNGTAALAIDASQNVGIGTTSPSYKLDVSGSTNPVAIRLFNSTAASGLLFTQDTSNNSFVNNQGNGYLGFATNNTERMRIDTSGNVGIGTTSPSARLHVSSSAGGVPLYVTSSAASQNVRIRLNSSDTSSSVAYVWSYSDASLNKQASIYLTSTGGLLTQVGQTAGAEPTTGTSAMFIDSSGNVGIGTTVAGGKLTVKAATNQNFVLQGSVSLANSVVISATNDAINANVPLEVRYATNTAWYDSGTERMRIDSVGRLLVGSTNSSGGIFKAQPATNICISVENATAVAGSLTLSAINDAATVNIPLDFRASAIYASGGIGTTASAANAFFNNAASNQFLRSTSALKYKTNIRDLESIDINKFRPVRYNSLCEADDPHKEHFGIIADEVANSGITELVTYGENGDVEGFQYERLTVVLVKSIQELAAQVTSLKAELDALKGTK